MRPAPFIYSSPDTLADALLLLDNGAVALAGGQSLLPAMRMRDATPGHVCAIQQIGELDNRIEFLPNTVRIGALVTHRELAEHESINREMPWLAEAARALGDVQVRNLGTVLGNVCWADPRANFAVALLASDAAVVAAGSSNPLEVIALSEFFTGFRLNTLGARLATALEIPRRQAARGIYREFSRQQQDLALVNVCVIRTDTAVRIAVGGIDPTPVRLREVEMVAASGGLKVLSAALDNELTSVKHRPIEDPHGPANYKLELAGTLIRRALVPRAEVQHG